MRLRSFRPAAPEVEEASEEEPEEPSSLAAGDIRGRKLWTEGGRTFEALSAALAKRAAGFANIDAGGRAGEERGERKELEREVG